MSSESARAYAFTMLRRTEPDNHLLECPDAVVIEGSRHPDRPAEGGGRWVTLVVSIQCGHGRHAVKLTLQALIMPNEPERFG